MKTLLIGPDPKRRRTLLDVLAARGHEVTFVEEGDAACQALEEESHPLVFVDADALGDAAAGVCRQLRSAPGGRTCLLIALGERDDPDYLETLLTSGADDYAALPDDGRLLALRLEVFQRRARGSRVAAAAREGTVGEATDRERVDQQRYRLIADSATDMIWTARIEGVNEQVAQMDAQGAGRVAGELLRRWEFTYVSPAVRRLLEYDDEEFLALKLAALMTEESRQRATDLLAEELLVEQEPSSDPRRQRVLELQLLTKHGSVKWCELTTTFLRDENARIAGVLGVTRDITERRQAEAALRKSEATLRGLMENMPDVVFVLDPNGVIQYINRGTQGLPQETLVGMDGFSLLSPHDHDRCLRALGQAFKTAEVQHVDAVGAVGRLWSCRVIPMVEDDHVRSVMVIATDVTEWVRAEETVREEQELLRQMLELHERDRELIAFELHDGFAQLLAGAMMNVQVAAGCQQSDPDRVRASLEEAARLLRESIDESRRLIRGLRPPVLEELGVRAAVEHLVEESQALGGPEIELICEGHFQRLARPLETAVFRIVQETLTNARKHSRSQKVRVELAREEDHLLINVQDWGVGFDPEAIREGSFGIRGVRERARLLGGQAEIRSAPGEGTSIRVRLPLVSGAQGGTDDAG